MNIKLLLDENVSPKVAEILCKEDGIDACGVRDRGALGALDHEVLELAFAEDRILVTSNVDDFVKLARTRDVHSGIIMIEGGLLRDEQLHVVRQALKAISTHGEMANTVLWVAADGGMTFDEVPLPSNS